MEGNKQATTELNLRELIVMDFKKIERFGVAVSKDGKVMGRKGNLLKVRFIHRYDRGPKHKSYQVVDVSTKIDGAIVKKKNYGVHRLVAEAYLQDWSKDLEVNHIDLDRSNNNASNLEMVTRGQNLFHGRNSNGKTNRTAEMIMTIRQRIKEAPRTKTGRLRKGVLCDLAKEFGVTRLYLKDLSRTRADESKYTY